MYETKKPTRVNKLEIVLNTLQKTVSDNSNVFSQMHRQFQAYFHVLGISVVSLYQTEIKGVLDSFVIFYSLPILLIFVYQLKIR